VKRYTPRMFSAKYVPADAASRATGGSHDEQIDKVESAADDRIGNA